MWVMSDRMRSASVLPEEGGTWKEQGWAALGLPETGWVLVVDEEQCQLCPDPTTRPCLHDCRVFQETCSFCADLMYAGDLPICVDTCPHGAIWVGNLERNNATNGIRITRLSELLKHRRLQVEQPDRRTLLIRS